MKDKKYDILDDEFRIIGKPVAHEPEKPKKSYKICFFVITFLLVITVVCLFFYFKNEHIVENEEGVFEDVTEKIILPSQSSVLHKFGRDIEPTVKGFTEELDTTINDIPLKIFIPHNATAELVLGRPDLKDSSIIFCTQAADIRRDNGKIVGAFVLKGQPLAWGLSKKGYCAIINSNISVGVADNSPLFEEATEKGGYFFRQYPLVNNGTLVENEPKNKAIRKAVCQRNNQTFIISSVTKESFHDFAQALVDLGIDNAIYLVGSEYANGWYRVESGSEQIFSLTRKISGLKYENYIIWRTK